MLDAARDVGVRVDISNMPPLPGIFPDMRAPVIANAAEGRLRTKMRWGMPFSPSR